MTDKRPSAVREMFASIAPRYDFLNHLLSACIDRRWRAFTARKLREALPGPPPLVLDLCCGTGDLALELHSLSPSSSVVGCDFCHPMLVLGARKAHRARRILLVEGDALRLPFGDNLFDALTIGFGLRNLESLESGLREMRRVLRPDGVLAILEFSRPRPSLLRPLFQLYLVHLLPRLGDWLSGHRGPYS
ncbi:MAG: ubiquinone/menaquinone biosynthesis methyltransferase, partial [Acidobacteria bacterium]|nr:ubiquinone/menaquinone biosynthesis methyltransferase [Acidobacteriota bacterium]